MQKCWVILCFLVGCGGASGGSGPAPSDPERSDPQRSLDALGAAAGTGDLPRDVVKRKLKEAMPAIEKCYADGLDDDRNLRGSVKTRITIGEDGKVKDADDAGSTLPDRDVLDCIRDAYEDLTFPPPKGGPMVVVHPLDLG